MIRFCLTLITTLSFIFATAQERKYPVSEIPPALLKKADVVKRVEQIEFHVISTSETVLRTKYAYTILNERGDRHAYLVEYYDKLRRISSIDGALYDGNGNLLRKVKGKELMDLSAVDDNNIMDDSRRKVHAFEYRQYPYTIEYEVVTKFNHTFYFPTWMPQDFEHLSVQQSSYTLICPEAYDVRYRSFNYKEDPIVTTEKGKKKMYWSISNKPAVERPFASPSWSELTTVVYFAPSQFEIEGYKGDMSSWNSFGKFMNYLNTGRDALPPNIVQAVQQQVAGVTDDREKVRLVYQYLQNNTRYISIQLGIGGWQTFEASYVAKKGYGDCKALTNYMYSMLKVAGIKSNPALIYAGERKDALLEDFPCNRFNHVVLFVPMQKDTLWLQCTSQDVPAGYMGEFTGNRKALMYDETGGKVVTTPHYGLRENVQLRNIQAKLNAEGDLNMKVVTRYGGTQQDDLSGMIHQLSKEKVQEVLQKRLALATYDIRTFNYQATKAMLPELEEQLEITARNYASVSGKRIFIVPNILTRTSLRLDATEERKFDFVFADAYRDEDRVEIEIPEGYELESSFRNVQIKTAFASYTASAEVKENKIIYTRTREQYEGRFPATHAAEISNFLESVFKADHTRIVLVKKGS
jgi:hypothetical protein